MEKIGIELEEALAFICDNTKEITDVETVDLLECNGRILAEPMIAPFDNPPFPKSPLDGYAFAATATQGATKEKPVWLDVVATVYAGDVFKGVIRGWQAAKVTTGAAIPEGCTCVVRQEDVVVENGRVKISVEMEKYQNYCFQGEDYLKGTKLVDAGTRLSFIEIGLLASAGIQSVSVYRLPRIALLTTGDEVVLPGQKLPKGKIYGSNLHLIHTRLKDLAVDIKLIGQKRDDPEEVAAAIREVAGEVDAIITTGGVSVGDKDIFHQVLPLLECQRLFWRVKMKPGTPAMFSLLAGVPLLSLSGNPFAAITTFELLARPMIAKLRRDDTIELEATTAILEDFFHKESLGRRFIRGCYKDGKVKIPDTYMHASGVLSSMRGCNCLIDIKAGTSSLSQGTKIKVLKL